MNSLLSVPLLPENKVSSVFVSYDYPEIISALSDKYNIEAIKVVSNPELDTPICSHADCMLVQLDNHTLITERNNYNNIVNYLTIKKSDKSNKLSIIMARESVKSPYPYDVQLNVKVIGKRIICNLSTVAKEIKDFADKYGFQIIHTNQGYAACSSIVINDNAIITDDESIYASAKSNGIDALLISKGSVILKGYKYGFIGGTCGMISKNLLAFTGKLSSHSDADKILSFLRDYNIDFVELSNGPLIDIGGIIPVSE